MKGAKLLGTEWKSAKGSDINREALRACPDGGWPCHQDPGHALVRKLPEAGWDALDPLGPPSRVWVLPIG